MKRSGFSVIEVIVALGIAAVVIATVGNLVGATHRLTTNSGKEIQAAALAKQWIELSSIPATTQSIFGCSCNTPGACTGGSPNTCRVGAQTCRADARPGFSSCWVAAPQNFIPFSFSGSGPWTAADAPSGFIRTLTINNLARDGSGALTGATGCTTDCNTKKVTVSICWGNNDCTNPADNHDRLQLSTILTAWKNF